TPGPNLGGTQVPSDGNAYMAMVSKFSSSTYREYAGTMLSAPLVVGQSYTVDLDVSLTDISQYGSDRFGVVFTTTPSVTTNNFAHVFSTTVISDRNNWTTISGTFVATQPYTYVFVGNFYDDANTTLTFFPGGGFYAGAYYFADNIRVTPATVLPSNQLSLAHLANEGDRILLGWEQPDGADIVRYTLERSLDNGTSYEEVTQIGQGEKTVLRHRDAPGRYHTPIMYRLRSVDAQGHSLLSNIVTATLTPGSELGLNVFPKPAEAGEEVTVKFTPVNMDAHHIEVLDLPGRKVYETAVLPDAIGDGIKIDTRSLAAGTYLVRLRAGNQTEVKKMSIVE
ncbi:MAG: T9SS type A sorting domain-containing protein, partial [Bacteroidota bacterium]